MMNMSYFMVAFTVKEGANYAPGRGEKGHQLTHPAVNPNNTDLAVFWCCD